MPEPAGGAVEDPEHDLLAERRRQDGDAEVDGMAVVADRDAAVLGVAAVGDVELAHDLEAARDARASVRSAPRRCLPHHAVDAGADDHRVRLRLEVDVRGALGDRVGDDLVRQLDRGRVGDVALGDVLDAPLPPPPRARPTSISTWTFARKQRSSVRARSETETTTKRIWRPSARRRSSEAITSVGSVTATITVSSSSKAIGSAERRRATFSGRRHVAVRDEVELAQLDELEAVLLGERLCDRMRRSRRCSGAGSRRAGRPPPPSARARP